MTDRDPAPMDQLPPVVSHRLELPSIADIVDQQMERIPASAKLDMSLPEDRERFATWMASLLTEFLHRTESAFEKGAQRGVNQVAKLIADPDYYRTAAKRRRKHRERYERNVAESGERSRKQREEQASAFKAQLAAGKIALFPGLQFDAGALPDDQKGPQP